jgi:hypothetical protein
MKHLKKFENWAYQNNDIQNITIDELREFVNEPGDVYLVAIEGETTGQNMENDRIQRISTNEFAEIINDYDSRLPVKVVLIDGDAFSSIPASIIDSCQLFIIEGELTPEITNSIELYSLPY